MLPAAQPPRALKIRHGGDFDVRAAFLASSTLQQPHNCA